MTPEEKARQRIDAMLTASGWAVQTKDEINLSASRGVAVCELSFATGEPDYTLFVEAKAIGTVEAKPEGHSLVGVEEQSNKYVTGVPARLPAWKSPLPFCYESTGAETCFTPMRVVKRVVQVSPGLFWVRLTSCGAQRTRSGVTRASGGTNDPPYRVAVAQRLGPS